MKCKGKSYEKELCPFRQVNSENTFKKKKK